MISTSRTLVPVGVQLTVENQAKVLKEVQKGLQDTFSQVDPSSSLGKGMNKLFDQIEQRFGKLDGILGQEVFSEGDLTRASQLFNAIYERMAQIERMGKSASAKDLGLDVTEIEKAHKALTDIQKVVKEQKAAPVATALGKESAQLKEFVEFSEKTGFSGSKNYTQNINALSSALGDATASYEGLRAAAEQAEAAVAEANARVQEATRTQEALEQKQAAREQTNLNAAQSILGVAPTRKGRTKNDVLADYDRLFESQLTKDGSEFIAGGKDFASVIAEWLNVDSLDLEQPAVEIVNKLKQALRTAIQGNKTENFGTGPLRTIASNVVKNSDFSADGELGRIQEIQQQTAEKLKQAQEDVSTTSIQAQEANDNFKSAEQLLELINTQLEKLRALRKQYEASVDESHRAEVDAAKQAEKDAENAVKEPTITGAGVLTGQARGAARETGVQADLQRNLNQQKAEAQAQSEQFSNQLKASVRQWMGAAQVVNLIKNGIRQAWQDIQGLDKAMTNIAVVTDMSVSDLWGKINEYMSIAQQYGVTTQGVYEVSQLYYQQGLSTSEVMAATTETLKMARR